MENTEKLSLIERIIADAEEFNDYDGDARTAFYEAVQNVILVIVRFGEDDHGE